MPKKFTEQEREWINLKLLKEGRRCFEVQGIKKTSVEELTKAAGIAQGSFYMFFSSKEELFFQILLEEEQRIRIELFNSFSLGLPVTKEGIKLFLQLSFRLMEQNLSEDKDVMIPLIMAWQGEGIMAGVDPGLIARKRAVKSYIQKR